MAAASMPLVERLSRRWWFFLLLLIALFFPAYTRLPLNPADTPKLVIEVLSNALAYTVPVLFPIIKLIALVLVVGLARWSPRPSRWFYAWAGLNLLAVAIFQDMAFTKTYGFAVLVGNLIVYGLVGLLWLRAAVGPSGAALDLAQRLPLWRYWVVPFALLAFAYPVNTATGIPTPDFSPLGLEMNEAGLTFCMMLPVYLAVLTLAYPRVDRTVLRISGFVGLLTGLLNVVEFLLIPIYGPWMATLHIPLLVISIYAFALSMKKDVGA